MEKIIKNISMITLGLLLLSGCGRTKDPSEQSITLTLGAFTVPKEVYQKKIIPAFTDFWKEKTGQNVRFEQSYEASGAQSRAIRSGFEADIAALSLEKDIESIRKAGLITHDWKKNRGKGFITRSIVIIAHRPGNPKNIKGLDDLKHRNIEVIYPSPKTSGGAMWVVNTIYGAGLKISEIKTGRQDISFARDFLKSIQKRVKVMDKSGRMSVTTFENGIGDALLTYENEALLRQKQGREFPFIIPDATILIENPIALVDKNVDRHKNREVAEAFVEFLYTKESQRSFADYGFRPVNNDVALEYKDKYPMPKNLFDINYLGGWKNVQKVIYAKEGIWNAVVKELSYEN